MAENNNNSFDAAIAMRDLKAYNGNDTFVLGRLYNAIQDIKIQNEQEKEAIFILLDNTDEMSDDRKARVVKIKEEMTKAYDAAEKKNTATKTVVTAQTKTEITEVKTTLLENLPIVQSYAQHINLGSALALIKAQKGSDLPAQLAAAKKAVQDSQIANSGISIAQTKTEISGYTFSRSQVGSRESEQRRNALRAIEAAKLLDFIDALAKDPNTERLLKSNIPADRILGKDAPLLDLIMDFNDDGVLESINSTDKSTLWNQFRGVFGFSTAMQGEFVGENQARKAMDKAKLDAVLKKYEIERKQDEPLQDFAKRARSTLLLRADMLGSTDMSVDADKSIYTSSKKNKDALVATTKLITELKESIREKVPSANISPEEVNDIANKMSANVLRWVTTVGIGAINMDTVLTKMGQAVVVGKGPGIENFLALDETVMVTILKAETLKLGASAGAWVGAGSGELVPFAHIGINGQLTALNNADLTKLRDMKRNFTIGVGANAGLAFQNGMSLSPVPSLDIKWDDRIDTIENATIRLGSYLDAATVVADEKITLDLTKVPQDIDPSLSNALTMLASIIEEGGGNLSPDEKMAHAILMKSRFLAAFKLSLAAESKLGGFSLSGVKFAFLPGALGFGPSFQNVGVARNAEIATKSEARKLTDISEQNTKLAEYGLKLDGKTLTQTAGFDATKITLKDGLAWDAGKSITLASNEAFVITGGLLSDTLGTSSGSLTIRKSVAKVAVSSSDIAATLISAENADLGADLNRLIDGLNIDTLIVRSDMQRFMAAMTKMDISTASNIMEKSTPALKAIHKVAKKENKLDAVTQVINARLVGDNITRGFNKAKSDPKFFVQYKNALIANAHSKGIEKKEITRLSALTRDKLTVGDISFVFNSKSLRNQELNIMSTTLWLQPGDETILRNTDQKLIADVKNNTELQTQDHGYLLMVRNRRGRGLQGIVQVPNGGYLAKEEMKDLSMSGKMKEIKQMKGLGSLVKTTVLSKISDAPLRSEIEEINASKFVPDNNGKIVLPLSNERTMTLDMWASRVSAALYGEVTPKKTNAVCLNVATLLEPVLSGSITGPKGEVVLNEMTIANEDVGAPGGVTTSDFALTALIPTEKPNTPPSQKPPVTPTPPTPTPPTPTPPTPTPPTPTPPTPTPPPTGSLPWTGGTSSGGGGNTGWNAE